MVEQPLQQLTQEPIKPPIDLIAVQVIKPEKIYQRVLSNPKLWTGKYKPIEEGHIGTLQDADMKDLLVDMCFSDIRPAGYEGPMSRNHPYQIESSIYLSVKEPNNKCGAFYNPQRIGEIAKMLRAREYEVQELKKSRKNIEYENPEDAFERVDGLELTKDSKNFTVAFVDTFKNYPGNKRVYSPVVNLYSPTANFPIGNKAYQETGITPQTRQQQFLEMLSKHAPVYQDVLNVLYHNTQAQPSQRILTFQPMR